MKSRLAKFTAAFLVTTLFGVTILAFHASNRDLFIQRVHAQAGVDTTGKTSYNSQDLFGSLVTNHSGTKYAYPVHIVADLCTLGTDCAVTFAGIAAFSAATSYHCAATDQTAAAAVKVVNTSATVATFTGTGTDVLGYVCVGN